tara:strand:- start:1257 stop:2375 length:1119 start_codon:yes stop_codon:yes gene_type:complete
MALGDLEGASVGFRKGPDTWVARLWDNSAYTYHALGRFEDHRAAIREARAWVKASNQGVVNHDATVADACDAYLRNLQKEKSERATSEARTRLQRSVLGRNFKSRKIAANPIARTRLAKLRPDHIEKWRDNLVPDNLEGEALRKARASANREMSALIAALNYAHSRRMAPSDLAWSAVKKFKDVQARNHRRYVSPEDRRALLDAAAKVGGGAVRDLLEGLMLTGARPIELARARVRDYDAQSGTLALLSYKGRSGEPRTRDVPARALRASKFIERLCRNKLPAAPIFTRDDGGPWGHSDWDGLVREARDRAGIETMTAYDLRHSFITEALNGGVDPLTVALIVGTSLEMISKTYGKLVEKHTARAFKNVDLT